MLQHQRFFDSRTRSIVAVLPAGSAARGVVEAGVTDGWRKYVGSATWSVDHSGESAPAGELFRVWYHCRQRGRRQRGPSAPDNEGGFYDDVLMAPRTVQKYAGLRLHSPTMPFDSGSGLLFLREESMSIRIAINGYGPYWPSGFARSIYEKHLQWRFRRWLRSTPPATWPPTPTRPSYRARPFCHQVTKAKRPSLTAKIPFFSTCESAELNVGGHGERRPGSNAPAPFTTKAKMPSVC